MVWGQRGRGVGPFSHTWGRSTWKLLTPLVLQRAPAPSGGIWRASDSPLLSKRPNVPLN